jgi:hypothetical protein
VLAWFTGLGMARGSVGGSFKARVAASAASAVRGYVTGSRGCQICEQVTAIGVPDKSARGHFDDEVFSTAPGFLGALAGSPAGGLEFAFVAKLLEGSSARGSQENDVGAPAAVTAVRTALGYKTFAAEGYTTLSAAAGFY